MCIFCKIISGEIPATMVYEDDALVAFLDARPVNVGHTLVVPKVHATDLRETPDDIVARAYVLAKRIGTIATEKLAADGFNIGTNIAPAAGQIVMHTHIHVIPRFEGDGLQHWPKRDVPEEESTRAATAYKEALS